MFKYSNFKLIGLKENDITSHIYDLMDNAKDVIVIGGYSFTKPSDVKSPLNKLINVDAKHKHCIFPLGFFGQKQNVPYAMELIKNNVSVSFEHENHSKWLMTENGMYFGSANFSKYSLKSRIEVVTFKDFETDDPFRKEFGAFTRQSMIRMKRDSNRANLKGQITRNYRLAENTKRCIKRLNPSIRKVYKTIEGVHTAHSYVNEILQNSFWFLDMIYYRDLNSVAQRFSINLNEIYNSAMKLVINYEEGKDIDQLINVYNSSCHNFLSEVGYLPEHSERLFSKMDELPKHTLTNRNLIDANFKYIKEMVA